ncbi:MAG: type II secretion system F family protein [Alphaproteobacteria bacterium]
MDLINQLNDPQFLIMVTVAVAAFATILTVVLPLLDRQQFDTRMKAMAKERSVLRQRQRETMERQANQPRLRQNTQGPIKQVVEALNLRSQFDTGKISDQLKMAGLRGPKPLNIFIFCRIAAPLALFSLVGFYLIFLGMGDLSGSFKLAMTFGAAVVGYYLPNIFLNNLIQRRQESIKRSFPDSLDLLLICVEAGVSIEAAFQRVSKEIAAQSIEMAEEMALTTAELSYLQERRQAYENMAKRIGLEGVRGVATSLIQAERYGTPLAQSLRVMAQENRDMRMAEAEKKAAALPPKLTVPMIAFFLPVLFVVILGPAIIKVMAM